MRPGHRALGTGAPYDQNSARDVGGRSCRGSAPAHLEAPASPGFFLTPSHGGGTIARTDRRGIQMARSMAWGAKVSKTFRDRVLGIESELGISADHLMAAMAFESGETFRADVKNAAGSGATGLIQFMPATAMALGTTVEKLAAMTPEDQLNDVYKYFKPYAGRLRTLSFTWPSCGHVPLASLKATCCGPGRARRPPTGRTQALTLTAMAP